MQVCTVPCSLIFSTPPPPIASESKVLSSRLWYRNVELTMFEKKKAFGKGISWIVLIAYERLLMYCKFATFMHGKGGVNFAELP
ncbi:hypothetical protein C5167_033484 [Papaver somniferum]|uniref:Uncharacterized protein n=1 Tax=Papaver somniferum TaxID=3469 RepID=A0A4Y7KDC0_PAPSO|nr:hypothetical protein C5167_033484 [Papaver somniferum]